MAFIGIAPLSWMIGKIRTKPSKVVYAFGPLRLSLHSLSEANKGLSNG